jgi:hypothetical protein
MITIGEKTMSSESIVAKARSITREQLQEYSDYENDSTAEESLLSDEELGLIKKIQRRRN